ncbi:hypothetical protein [Actinotalea sp. JY-7876]|uniref:hypothetical protein n=1 Tax=Actinotalea sp. JY-7876 TaxID=2758442 RepID=UPI0015F37342|nr:hypothetical protein [Actinotalea sp. JY-7876]
MTSDLDAMLLAGLRPVGPPAAADTSLITTGTVLAVNADAGLVQVAVRNDLGAAVEVPAVAARYRPGGSCRVAHNPFAGGRSEQVLGAVDPLEPSVPGTLTAIDTEARRATVTVLGGSYVLPYLPSTYTVGTSVWVDLDGWGRPYRVGAPSDLVAAPAGAVPPPSSSGRTVQATVTIMAQWSGSYRSGSGWDRWNVGRYGGRSTLYQGSGYGSGPMKGLAVYGDQVVNLGATSLDRVRVMLLGVGLSGASGPATVQGSPHGAPPSGAPASSGSTATGDGATDLPGDVREDMRTGAVKALALVGSQYWAVAGAGNGAGMALEVTHTRPA